MPTLAAPLDFAKLEGRNLRAHQLGAAPSSPVTGQLYYNNADNTLYWYDGTQWVSARGGGAAVGDATPTTKGVVQLAGDLAGTAASPQIAAGVITDADVNTANKDGVVAIPSLRTLGNGAQQAMAGNTTLDLVPRANNDVDLHGQVIKNLMDPSNPSDAVTKQYADALIQGLDAHPSVKAASTGNLTLSGTQTVDGVALVNGDRVLVKDQTNPAQNGIYQVSSTWFRPIDIDTWPELVSAFVFVEQGTVNADTGWVSTADQGGTLNTTSVVWVQFSAAGQIVGGAGLTKTGNSIDVGAGAGITVNPDSIQVANDGITHAMIADAAIDLSSADVTSFLPLARGGTNSTTAKGARETGLLAPGYYSSATHGAGTTISIFQFNHGLRASRGLVVQVQDEATGNVELADVSITSGGDVTVTFGASVAANSKRVTILG